MILPNIMNISVLENINDRALSSELPIYIDYAWDFNKNSPILIHGEFKKVEKNEALKVWIYKCLKVERFLYDIYSWDYGCEFLSMIGNTIDKDLLKLNIYEYIRNSLLVNEYIKNVEILDVFFDIDTLKVTIKVHTIYGEVYMDV